VAARTQMANGARSTSSTEQEEVSIVSVKNPLVWLRHTKKHDSARALLTRRL